MHDLEDQILIGAMGASFLHCDCAMACRRDFTGTRRDFVRELSERGLSVDEICNATADFARASQYRQVLDESARHAARAMALAHA